VALFPSGLGFSSQAVGIELLRALKTRKLLILQNGKLEKSRKNAELRHSLGTRNNVRKLFDFAKRKPADCSRYSMVFNRLVIFFLWQTLVSC
jgi:hypothetical protein